MKPGNKESTPEQHPLAEIPELSPDTVCALKGQWIETAEQVLALSASEEGQEGLKTLLGLDDTGLGELLDQLAEIVGPDVSSQLRQPTPGGPCGVILTDEQRRRFGVK